MDPGPIDESVLYHQGLHRSQVTWDSGSENKVQTRNSDKCPVVDIRVQRYLYIAGFYGLYHLGYIRMDRPLITALAERWRPETHTFHMACGECTISLQDIAILCGVPIDGKAIISDDWNQNWAVVVNRLIGVMPEPKDIRGGKLSMKWLRSTFTVPLPVDAPEEVVQCRARASIMLLLGGQFLSDKSGAYVKLRYLLFLEDLEECRGYSWGTAILATMYKELCGCAYGNSDIAGPLIVVQLWAWIRFPFIRPVRLTALQEYPDPGDDALPVYTYGYRWALAAVTYDPESVGHQVRFFRDQFDGMQKDQIVWEPYMDILDNLPAYCLDGSDIWCARVPLICFEAVEYYYPDRVLRQFGKRQFIPGPCFRYDALHDIDGRGNAKKRWAKEHKKYVREWENRNQLIVDSVDHGGWMPVDEQYMPWYKRITFTRMRPVVPRPAQGFQPSAGRLTLMETLLQESYAEFRSLNNERMVTRLTDGFTQLQIEIPPASAPYPHQAEQHPHNTDDWVDDMITDNSLDMTSSYHLDFAQSYQRRRQYGEGSSSQSYEPHTQTQTTEVPRRMRRVSSVNRDEDAQL